MRRSLTATTFDLLSYDGYGNFSKFDRCFSKACHFLSLNLDENARRKYRNFAFHYLRATGFIDVNYSATGSRWATAPNSLVQCGQGSFVAIGTSIATNRAIQIIGSQRTEMTRSQESFLLSPDVALYPSLPRFTLDELEARDVAKQSAFGLSLNFQDKVFALLPAISTILSAGLVRADSGPIFEPGSTSRFDFAENAWTPCQDTRPLDSGLFRKEHEYAPAEYYISFEVARNFFEVSKVIDREWVAVCAMAKLGQTLPARYVTSEETLQLPRPSTELRLPTLLERCLRSGSFSTPRILDNQVTYDGISQRNLWRLKSKLPMLQVEVI